MTQLDHLVTIKSTCCENKLWFSQVDPANSIRSYSFIYGLFLRIFGISVALRQNNKSVVYVNRKQLDNWLRGKAEIQPGMNYELAINQVCANRAAPQATSDTKATTPEKSAEVESGSRKKQLQEALKQQKGGAEKPKRKEQPQAPAIQRHCQGFVLKSVAKDAVDFLVKVREKVELLPPQQAQLDAIAKLEKMIEQAKNPKSDTTESTDSGKKKTKKKAKTFSAKQIAEMETQLENDKKYFTRLLPIHLEKDNKWIMFAPADYADYKILDLKEMDPSNVIFLMDPELNAYWPKDDIFAYKAETAQAAQKIRENNSFTEDASSLRTVNMSAVVLDVFEEISSKESTENDPTIVRAKINSEKTAYIIGPTWAKQNEYFRTIADDFMTKNDKKIVEELQQEEWMQTRLKASNKQTLSSLSEDADVQKEVREAIVKAYGQHFLLQFGFDVAFVYSKKTDDTAAKFYLLVLKQDQAQAVLSKDKSAKPVVEILKN